MTSRLRSVTVLLLALLFGQVFFSAQKGWAQTDGKPVVQAEATALKPDSPPIEREIKGTEVHAYGVDLPANSCLNLKIEQKGIDIRTRVRGADGNLLLETNFYTNQYGPDFVTFVTAAAGTYRVELTPDEDSRPGTYRLTLLEIRTALPTDRDRMQAQHTSMEAYNLLAKGTKEGIEAALPLFETTRQGFHRAEDAFGEGYTLDSIGTLHRLLGNKKEAKAAFQQSLPLKKKSNYPMGEATTLNMLAIICNGLSQWNEALEYSEQALKICVAQGDKRYEATLLSNRGNIYRALGDYRKALELLQKAVPLKEVYEGKIGQAETLNNIGLVYNDLAEIKLSLDYYLKSLALLEKVPLVFFKGTLLNNAGLAYKRLGEYQKALDYYEQALQVARSQGNPDGEGLALTNLGIALLEFGQPRLALTKLMAAQAIWEKTGNRQNEATGLNNLALAHRNMGKTAQGLELYTRSLALRREIGDRLGEATTLNNLGLIRFEQNDVPGAVEYFKQALEKTEANGDRDTKALVLFNLGNMERKRGQPEAGLPHLEQSLALCQSTGNRFQTARTLIGLAATKQALDRLPEAKAHAEAALELVEFLRSRTQGSYRTSFFAVVQSYFEQYISILLDMHRKELKAGFDRLALQVSEQARARALLDLLGEARLDLRKGASPQLIQQEQDLKQRITNKYEGLARLLARKYTPEQRTAVEQEIATLTEQYRVLQTEIRQKSPAYAALVQPKPLALETIQTEILDSDTLLLEYMLGEDHSQVFAITKTSFTVYELPPADKINQKAQRVYDLLNQRTKAVQPPNRKQGENAAPPIDFVEQVAQADREYPQAAAELSRMILGPLQKELGSRRLVIVPDGRLHLIPFAALPSPETAAGKDAPYLIEQHEILSQPSISVLSALRQEREKPAQTAGVVVMADPVFEATDIRLKEIAAAVPPSPAPGKEISRYLESFYGEASPGSNQDSSELRAFHILRLPGTRLEAEAIRSIAGEQALVRLDFQASRQALLETDLSRFRYIHLATHGLMNFEHPDLSAVLLSLVDEKGNPVDGFLRLQDLYNLNWPAEVVTLSACQTGLGPNIKGEGLIGLTRGLMYAGARRVVVSSWNVNDRATAQLMTRFYQGMLRDGLRPAAALQAAQKQILAQRRWHAPYYWAAFQMQGDWR